MLGYLRASFLGAGLWIFLWAVDGRPYSALPWDAGLLLVLAFSSLPAVAFQWQAPQGLAPQDAHGPVGRWLRGRQSGLPGFALAGGLWATWRISDGSVGPGNAGSELSSHLLPFVAAAAALALAAALATWPRRTRASAVWMLCALAMVFTVGALSGQGGGADRMAEWLARLLHITVEQATPIVFYLRKTIHLSFYGFMACSSLWAGWHGGLYAEKAAAYGLSLALLLASFDELRQARVIGRSGSPWDVGLDVLGALLFLALAWRIARGREARLEHASPSTATSGPSERS